MSFFCVIGIGCTAARRWSGVGAGVRVRHSAPFPVLFVVLAAIVHCYATISWRNGLGRESRNAVQTHCGKRSRIEGINLRRAERGARRRGNEQSLLLHCEMYRIRMHKLFHFLNLRRWHAVELCAVMGERVRWWRMSNAWIIIASCLAIICKLPERRAHVCACTRDVDILSLKMRRFFLSSPPIFGLACFPCASPLASSFFDNFINHARTTNEHRRISASISDARRNEKMSIKLVNLQCVRART